MKTTFFVIALLGVLTASATTLTYDFSTTTNDYGSFADTFKSNPGGYAIIEYGFQDNQNLAILNIAGSGKFSSDRTISEYATHIWHVQPCPVD